MLHRVVCDAIPVGANFFFRKLRVMEQWRYTDNLQLAGTGSPFYSEEVKQFNGSVRRREIREGTYFKAVSEPVMSRDYVLTNQNGAGVHIIIAGEALQQVRAELSQPLKPLPGLLDVPSRMLELSLIHI